VRYAAWYCRLFGPVIASIEGENQVRRIQSLDALTTGKIFLWELVVEARRRASVPVLGAVQRPQVLTFGKVVWAGAPSVLDSGGSPQSRRVRGQSDGLARVVS
jgi:hypothetical protein